MMMINSQLSATSHVAAGRRAGAAPVGASLPPKGNPGVQRVNYTRAGRSVAVRVAAPETEVFTPTLTPIDEAPQADATKQAYRKQIVSVLGSFTSLPIDRLHNIIKFTSNDPRLTKSVYELADICFDLEEAGELLVNELGWMSLPGGGATEASPEPSAAPTSAVRPGSPIPVAVRVPTPRPTVAAYPAHLRELAPYHQQILGLMANFHSMPLTRLHSTLALTMISPKFNKSEAELGQFVSWLVEDGQLTRDAQTGWYSYFEQGSTVTTPRPIRGPARSVSPARTMSDAAPARSAAAAPAEETAAVWPPLRKRTRAAAPEPQRASPEADEEPVSAWMPKDPKARLPSPVAARGPAPVAAAPAPAPGGKSLDPEQNGGLMGSVITGVALGALMTFASTYTSSSSAMSTDGRSSSYEVRSQVARK